jgi:hypothetical protein
MTKPLVFVCALCESSASLAARKATEFVGTLSGKSPLAAPFNGCNSRVVGRCGRRRDVALVVLPPTSLD